MEALKFLDRLKKIPIIIENREADVKLWKERALNITSGGVTIEIPNNKGEIEQHNMEKVQTSFTGNSPMTAAVIKYLDIEKEIEQLKEERKRANAILEELETDEYNVLYKYHILEYSIGEIAAAIKKSYSKTGKIHKSALENLQKILNSIKKC